MIIGDKVFVARALAPGQTHFVKPSEPAQPEIGFVTYVNSNGSVNVAGFAADGSLFSLVGLDVGDDPISPSLPYYSVTAPAPVSGASGAANVSTSKPVVTQ
jgi:hypothetical protein